MEIDDGTQAFREFLRITRGDVPEEEIKRVREELEKYCERDTEGMVWIVRELGKIV